MTTGFFTQFRRELLIAFRNRGEAANPVLFFVMVSIFIPLGVSPVAAQLSEISAGMIWVLAMLATLLSVESLFTADYRDGSLDQMMLSPQPMYWKVLAKIVVHWIVSGLPITLLSPVLGLMLSLPSDAYGPLIISLFFGTFCLSAIGSIGAALTVAIRGGLLVPLLVMPLYVPVLIFGSAVPMRAVDQMSYTGPLAILAALMISMVLLTPFAVNMAIRAAK